MCSNIMKGGKRIMPYMFAEVVTGDGYKNLRFGESSHYNMRIETINTKGFRGFGKAFIEVESFWEGSALFEDNSSTYMKLACAWHPSHGGFFILTQPSKGTIIEPYHGRMPIVLEKPGLFLSKGETIQIDYKQRLQIAS